MNFGFSGEMFFIFFLALILFGPKKMPEIGRQVARFINEFRRASNEFRSQIESEINSLETSTGVSRQQILPPLQAPLGSLANRIFNPPGGEERPAVKAVTEAITPEPGAETSSAETAAAAETGLAPPPDPAPKVAPDA